MQNVVAPAPADARHHVLVTQVGGEMAPGVAGADELGEGLAAHLGPQPGQGSLVARRQHPPRRLALRAVLAHQHGDGGRALAAGREGEAGHRATGLRLLRRLLDVEAAGLGQMEHEPDAAVELPDQVLGPATDGDDPMALEVVGRRGVGLEGREPEQVGPLQRGPGQEGVEAFGQRLHLGHFGHATMYA